jgi:hypothetical protein
MPLIEERRAPSPLGVRPLPTALASLAAALLFVLVTGLVARCTRDSAGPVRAPVVDAGFVDAGFVDAGFVDAGFVDAGMPYGPTVDGGVYADPSVAPPPYDPRTVAKEAAAVVERCAADALRWDPSLGGAFTLRVDLLVGAAPRVTPVGLDSPVLLSCIERASPDFVIAVGSGVGEVGVDVGVDLVVSARARLDADGRVAWSDAAIGSPAPRR